MGSIELCKTCINQKFDIQQGLLCGLTNEKGSYEDACGDFIKDETKNVYQGMALRPNHTRGKVIMSLIWIVLVAQVMLLLSGWMQLNLLQTVKAGGTITPEAATSNDLRHQFINLIFLLAYIVSAITFIMWFRRAYYNLHQKVKALSYGDGWAAGAWFVPFINLYRPYEIMKELYEETKKYLRTNEVNADLKLETNILGAWWILWLVNGIFGQVEFRYARHAETISQLTTSTILEIIGSIIGIPLAIITIMVIKNYTKAEYVLSEN